MMKKVKSQKSFIQIPLLLVIIVSAAIGAGIGYGAVEYHKTSNLIKEANQLEKEEKYNEAIEKLEIAQNKLFGKLLKQKISAELDKNKKLLEDKSEYEQGIEEFNKGNLEKAKELLSKVSEDFPHYQDAKNKLEEVENKIIEQRVAEKSKELEEKAKKEEFARKLSEQQLLEKEEEERIMNADNDGDGLTYREELKLGTSDWNVDSDYDGIPDNLDLHPAGGGRNIPQTFEWSYGGYKYTLTYPIHEDWYEYYKRKPRVPQGLEYVTPNDPFIRQVAKMLKEKAEEKGYGVTLFIGAFIQSLPYTWDIYTGFDEYPKYPIETFVEKNGDCEDLSYLAASLISATGYGVALLIYDDHMAIGIKASPEFDGYYYELDDGRYYYLEVTAQGWGLGSMPDKYKNQPAKIVRVVDGKTLLAYAKYKKPCEPLASFPGYYTDGKEFYSDSNCTYLAYCIPYKDYYFNPKLIKLYWDSSCSQEVTIGCYKSQKYPGYFSDGFELYYDSKCLQKARVCRPAEFSYDKYYDGYDYYWDSNCTQKVVSGCYKSFFYPGYFFDGFDYYLDPSCTQKVKPY